MVEVIKSNVPLEECPFCHDPGFLLREPLWSKDYGYYGDYEYFAGCVNGNCRIQPRTKGYADIYGYKEEMIRYALDDWNAR